MSIETEQESRIILAFGASLTEGYHGAWYHPVYGIHNKNNPDDVKFHPYTIRFNEHLSKARHITGETRYTVMNAGVSGQTTTQMLPRLRQLLDDHQNIAFAFIIAGTNDVIQQPFGAASAAAIAEKIWALHSECHRRGIFTFAITLPDIDAKWVFAMHDLSNLRATLDAVNADLRRRSVDENPEQCMLVDLSKAIPQDEAHRELWDDAVHFSPKGYDLLGDIVFSAFSAFSSSSSSSAAAATRTTATTPPPPPNLRQHLMSSSK